MKFKKSLTLLSVLSLSALPLASVACSRTIDSSEKIKQDQDLKNTAVKNNAKNLFIESILLKEYNSANATEAKSLNELFEKEGSKLYEDAYLYFKTESAYRLSADSLHFLNLFSKWTQAGAFSASELEVLQPFFVVDSQPNEEAFKVLYKNTKIDFRSSINQALLVKKYFELTKVDDLKKLDSSYDQNKDNYDADQYNLIKYVLDKKPIQKWEYSSNDLAELFSWTNKQIRTVEDYQKLVENTYEANELANEDLLFSNNTKFEKKLGGYKGIVLNQASTYNLDFSLNALKATVQDNNSGFYSQTDKKLVKINEDGNLESPISLYNSATKKLSATYVNKIAPISKEETIEGASDNAKKVYLSFDNTAYAQNINKLYFALIQADSSLANTALKAFVKLGYKLETDNEIIKETLKGSDFI
ncbi:HinT-interacting membrane complex lipoprotein P60 [Mycoplasma sp. Ms02]|uniref:HinT-interacting membrane complex lipoprotein P60 n=1 Tax=Mycoplasma sp. Ms02 TaxID=353851 RepID=UPI001C8ADBD3|nr:hypothetical protein [Mycoplasma sp. Ms02]QZE12114.1 hypothetical protein K4L35_02030 [Mycoplasma sp. Ms02]